MIHINEITLEGDDDWTKQFNKCSSYWQKAFDNSLSEEDRELNFNMWMEERQRLELGIS